MKLEEILELIDIHIEKVCFHEEAEYALMALKKDVLKHFSEE